MCGAKVWGKRLHRQGSLIEVMQQVRQYVDHGYENLHRANLPSNVARGARRKSCPELNRKSWRKAEAEWPSLFEILSAPQQHHKREF